MSSTTSTRSGMLPRAIWLPPPRGVTAAPIRSHRATTAAASSGCAGRTTTDGSTPSTANSSRPLVRMRLDGTSRANSAAISLAVRAVGASASSAMIGSMERGQDRNNRRGAA